MGGSAATGLGLMSAASWGGSDFVGGLGARRAPALIVAISGQFVSLLALAGVCLGLRVALPGRHDLACAAIGGLEGSLGLALFYRALAMGKMGLTAALTGLLTALVPVLFAAFRYGLPAPLTAAGLAAGCAAIWFIASQPATPGNAAKAGAQRTALLLGATAGVGFGAQLILFKMASAASILAVMTTARAAGVAGLLAVVLFTRLKASGTGFWVPGIASGALDTVGSLFFLGAVRFGRLDVAAVLCSLYPAGTILLSAVLLHERLSRRQVAGMALALGAAALLSL